MHNPTSHRNIATTLGGFILAALALSACGSRSDLVARSDLGPVTNQDLDQYILSLPEEKRRPRKDQTLKEWRKAAAEDLIIRQAWVAETEAITGDPTLEASIENARAAVLVEALDEALIASTIEITEDQIKAYYDEHKAEFSNERQIRLRHIFRRVDRNASDADRAAARAEMEQMLAELRSGANFGDMAKERSDSDTAHLQGLIGRLSRGALDPALEEIVWNLEDGEISDVVSTPVGFHIFRLDDHIPAGGVTYDEARGRLMRRLEKLERERLEAELFDQLLAESGARYTPEYLDDPQLDNAELFVLDDFEIRLSDARRYSRQARFIERRSTPVDVWLHGQAWNRLQYWKAQQPPFGDSPEVIAEADAAERQARYEFARKLRLEAFYQELESDGTLEAHWDANYRRFQSPKLHKLRIIFASFEGLDQPYEAYEELEAIAARIHAGTLDMAEAARRYSDDSSAERGGSIGFVRLNGFGLWAGPRIQNTIARMAEGELSKPMLLEHYDTSRLRYDQPGYLLVRVDEIKAPEVLPFEQCRDQVRDNYYLQYPNEVEGRIRSEALASVDAEIFEENL